MEDCADTFRNTEKMSFFINFLEVTKKVFTLTWELTTLFNCQIPLIYGLRVGMASMLLPAKKQ